MKNYILIKNTTKFSFYINKIRNYILYVREKLIDKLFQKHVYIKCPNEANLLRRKFNEIYKNTRSINTVFLILKGQTANEFIRKWRTYQFERYKQVKSINPILRLILNIKFPKISEFKILNCNIIYDSKSLESGTEFHVLGNHYSIIENNKNELITIDVLDKKQKDNIIKFNIYDD